jgi:hypothetical protein
MSVLKKQGIYGIDDYINGRRIRARIDPDRWLAETVLRKCRAEITECRNLKKRWATQSILESTQSLHASFVAIC